MQTLYIPIRHLNKPPIRPGGLSHVYLLKKEDVLFFPTINPLSGTFTTPVILREGKTWYRTMAVDADRTYKEEQKRDTAGTFTEVTISCFLPDDSADNALTIAALPYHQFIVAVKDRSGIMRIVGTADVGATILSVYESSDLDGSRGYKLALSWKNPLPPPLYLIQPGQVDERFYPPWDTGLFAGEFSEDFN